MGQVKPERILGPSYRMNLLSSDFFLVTGLRFTHLNIFHKPFIANVSPSDDPSSRIYVWDGVEEDLSA